MDRPNFYILLELDPSVRDGAAIEAALRAKQVAWGQERNHPSKGLQAKQNLEMLPSMREVLLDPARRDAEAEAAVIIRREREREAAEKLDKAIALLAVEGFILEKEVAELVKRFKDFPEAEIRRRIKVPIRREEQAATPAVKPTLDRAALKSITENLVILKKKDLYDFLGLPRTASRQALLDRSRELNSQALSNNNKTAEVGAQQVLSGFGLSLFKEDADRQKYDNSIDQQGLVDLEKDIDLAGLGGSIPAQRMEELLRLARERGIAIEEARTYIVAYASRKKWSVQVPQAVQAARLLRCVCGVLNPEQAAACGACGEPLKLECPKCRTVNPSENRACTKCGFAVGDAPLVRRLIRDADLALADGHVKQAMQLVQKAKVYWPDSPEVRDRLARLAQKQAEEQQAHQKLTAALAARRFVEAQSLLTAWKRLAPDHPDQAGIEQQITRALRSAREHVARAQALQQAGKSDDAIDAYGEALRECQDLAEAREGLARCPPDPPREVKAVAGPRAVTVSWQPGPSRRPIIYRVLRRAESQAAGAREGELVGETPGDSLPDSSAEPGVAYTYLVYAVSEGQPSRQPARYGPVLALGEVGDLKARAADKQVSLSWKPPGRVKRIEVRRALGEAPPAPHEAKAQGLPPGELLATPSLSALEDNGLENERTYGYRVCCVFVGPDGKEVTTAGEVTTATPSAPPPLLRDLEATHGQGLRLAWKGAASAKPLVLRAKALPKLPAGQLLNLVELERLGTRLTRVAAAEAVDPAPSVKEPFYLLFSTNRMHATYCGRAQFVELTELSARVEPERVLLEWAWPPNCRAVRISRGCQDDPARGKTIAREGDAPRGRLELPTEKLSHGTHQFHVRCLLPSEEKMRAAGEGHTATFRVEKRVRLSWSLERGRKGSTLVVRAEGGLGGLTRLKLMGKINRLPESADDGRPLVDWKPPRDEDVDSQLRLPVSAWEGARGTVYCRLFVEPDDGATVTHPGTKESVL